MGSQAKPILCIVGLLSISLGSKGVATQDVPLGAKWIPTDLNYGVISQLRQNSLQSPADQIAGYSTLGIVSSDTVGAWLQQLINNPNFREGTVRWNPNDPSKCTSKKAGCTKSIHITILEFDYQNPNATDCNTTALVAADALLPPQAVFLNGNAQYWPRGPVQYQIIQAPNSTAGNCSYVVQYPQATQTLANTLCSQQSGGSSCYNSTCIPCNANQSIATSENPSGCTANSGIAPALVAAIEGAAQCLTSGGVGAFQCQVAYIANASACSQMHCFPGDGLVTLEGGRSVRMQELRIGDRVQTVSADGSVAYEDIYFFGHRSANEMGSFVKLTLEPRDKSISRQQGKFLELSPKHFLPVSPGSGQSFQEAVMKQARSVVPGDTVWAVESSQATAFRVAHVEAVSKKGLWAPYTKRGTIVINGVIASVHSDWVLDSLLEAIGRPELLPIIYQVLLSPVRLIYSLIGPSVFRSLDEQFDFGAILTSPYLERASHTLFLALIVLFLFPLGQKAGRNFAKRISQPSNRQIRSVR